MAPIALSLALLLSAPADAPVSLPNTTATEAPVAEHSGGCRKSSPPGQCCHAGSQPLHCH